MYINISKVDFGKYYRGGSGGGGVTPEPEPDYLCFTSTGDSTVKIIQSTPATNISKNKVIQYKLNNTDWQTWDLSTITLADGDKMYLKSDDEIPMSESTEIYKYFVMTGSIVASGNIMSLLNFSDSVTENGFLCLFLNCGALTKAPDLPATKLNAYCYTQLFNNCTALIAAPELPATTLSIACYNSMFAGCTALTQAPALPATTLVEACYAEMFRDCSSLINASELPATTLESYCYAGMFNGCTKLNHVKALFTDKTAEECLSGWLENVSPTGTFVKNSAATWTNEQAEIPTGWTVQTASPDK